LSQASRDGIFPARLVSESNDRHLPAQAIVVEVRQGEEGQGVLLNLSVRAAQAVGTSPLAVQRYEAFGDFANGLQWNGSTLILGPRLEVENEAGEKMTTGPVVSYSLTHAESAEFGLKLSELAGVLEKQQKDKRLSQYR